MSTKLNELGLKFDAQKMLDDLIIEFLSTLDNVANELVAKMEITAKDQHVQESIKKEIYMNGLNEIEIFVGSDNWKAFLENYGTGSLMADEFQNPWLEEYKQTYFHRFRQTNAVTKREAGTTYEIPNWETGYGMMERTTSENSPIPAGTNLEDLNWIKYHYKFKPTAPDFFLETSMQYITKRFQDEITVVFKRFPFNKYLVGGA